MKIPTIGNFPTRNQTTPGAGSGEKDPGKSEFQPGQLLRARVLRDSSPEGKVLLEVDGRRISARSLVKMMSGDHIWLEVNQGGDSPLLSLASQKGAVHHFLQIMFTNPQKPEDLLNQILPLLSQLSSDSTDSAFTSLGRLLISLTSLAQGGKPDPAALRLSALLYGGFDPGMKALPEEIAAQQLKGMLNRESLSPSLQKLLNESLEFLDRHQQINSSLPGHDDKTIYLFPCFFKEEAGWGEWMFSRAGKSNSEESSFELDFFLDMSNLGPLSLHISCINKDLNGKFYLREQRAVDYMQKRTPELEGFLHGLGYQTSSFQCYLSRKNFLREFKENLAGQAGLNSFRLVDLTA